MGSSLRDRCGSAVRALMLSAFLALAWLVWGAGTADAAPVHPGSGSGAVVLLDLGLPQPGPALPDGGSAATSVATHQILPVATRAMPTLSSLPGTSRTGSINEVPLPAAPPAKVVAAVAGTADAVLNEAPAAVATVAASAAPVLTSAAPVLTIAAPVLTNAAPVLTIAAPVLAPGSGALPFPLPVSAVLPVPAPLPPATGTAERPTTHQTSRPAIAPEAAASKQATAAPGRRTAGPGPSAALLPVNAGAVRAFPAVDGHLAPSSQSGAPLDPNKPLLPSAPQGPSGSSPSGPGAGPGAGGADAAGDTAGIWNPLDARRAAPAADTAQAPAAGPSFDPGSSPD